MDGGAREPLEAAIGHDFARRALLEEALTHPSAAAPASPSFERLEFLGDRVLGLAMADLLFRRFPEESEGDLARRFAILVSRDSLAAIAGEIGLGEHLRITASEDRAGARRRPALLADSFEAVIGAVFLDGGLAPAAALIERLWEPLVSAATPPRDAKTELQEWAQARGRPLPVYETVQSEGPPHEPLFTVEVRVAGLPPVRASGGSKRAAERDAAALLLERIASHDD